MPRTTSAATSLALAKSDYPPGALIAIYSATNNEADYLLSSAHRSSFQSLHREDGLGWVQAAIWHFKTGRGAATQSHRTTFGYAINVFHSNAQAQRALKDARIPRRRYRVAHLPALLYHNSDGVQTLVFLFFVYGNIEVESYYEYRGTAPTTLAQSLHHIFSRQGSHLAHLARVYYRELHRPRAATATPTRTPKQPTPRPATPTPSPQPTPTSSPVPSATVVSTSTPTATAIPTATQLPSPTPSPTPTPVVVISAAAAPSKPTFAPNSPATIIVRVTSNGQPVPGARVAVNITFPDAVTSCAGVVDASGTATCSVTTPEEPDGTVAQVSVQVAGPQGQLVTVTTSFVVNRTA